MLGPKASLKTLVGCSETTAPPADMMEHSKAMSKG